MTGREIPCIEKSNDHWSATVGDGQHVVKRRLGTNIGRLKAEGGDGARYAGFLVKHPQIRGDLAQSNLLLENVRDAVGMARRVSVDDFCHRRSATRRVSPCVVFVVRTIL